MANYSTLKAAVADVVKTNGTQAITGANLQSVLLSIINSVGGGGYIFKGVATPSTDAGTPDENVFYIGGAGTYANFGTSVTVPVGSIGVFKYNGSWTKEQIVIYVLDNVPTADSTNLITSGAVADIEKDLSTLDKEVNIITVDEHFKEINSSGLISYRFYNIGISSFSVKIDKIAGNQSAYSIRLSNNNGNTVLKYSCEFGVEYSFENVDIETYPDLFIYQGGVSSITIPFANTDYNIIVKNYNSVINKINTIDITLSEQLKLNTKTFGYQFQQNIKENASYSISYMREIGNRGITNFKVKLDKTTGNHTTYVIYVRNENGSAQLQLYNGAIFGFEYEFENIDTETYPYLWIYKNAPSSHPIDYNSTSYTLTFTATDYIEKDVYECVEDINKINKDLYGVQYINSIYEQPAAILSYTQKNIGISSFSVKIDKIAGNQSVYSIRMRNEAATSTITLQSNCTFGTVYNFENVDIETYPDLFIYQGAPSSHPIDYLSTKYVIQIKQLAKALIDYENSMSNMDNAVNTIGFEGKKIMMFGDSITQLPKTGSTTTGDGIVEYFAQKTGASVFRGAIGGSHLASRLANVPTTITTNNEARAALDVVNIVSAWANGDLSLQESASVFEGIDTYTPTTISVLEDNPINSIDIVTIFAGTNDCNSDVPLGENNFDITTVKGAINVMVRAISQTNPNIKIFIFTPTVRWWANTAGADWNNSVYWCDNYGDYTSVSSVSELGALTAENLGKIYKITSAFTTTSDFVKYVTNTTYTQDSGTEKGVGYVAIINTAAPNSTPVYKYVCLNGNPHKLYNYVDAIIDVSKSNHVPCCDLYNEMGWNVYNYRNFCVNTDGTHPRNGFQHIATKMVGFILSHQNKW